MRDLKGSTCTVSRETKKIRKILHEEVRLGINPNSDSETEGVDLHKELHPLSHYINNREEMIEQMFSIIKGVKLKKMLPPALKDMPLDELKADCLIHLLGMSTKRIQAILEGREINSSSDSETHSDSSPSPSKKAKGVVKPIVIKQEGCSDISDNSEEVVLVDPDLQIVASCKETKDLIEGRKKSKRHHGLKENKRYASKNKMSTKKLDLETNATPKEIEDSDDSIQSCSDSGNNDEVDVPKEGKTLLEILELEMRARAIRALLQKGNTPECEDNESTTDKSSKKTKNTKGKSINQLIESNNGATKVTPSKNFRKKKRKNDDVIVITPKLVTIDLTDEKDPGSANNKTITEHKQLELGGLLNRIQDHTAKEVEESNNLPGIVGDLGKNPICLDNVCAGRAKIAEREPLINSEPVVSLNPPENRPVQLDAENSQKAEQPKSSWAQRWLESKEVKKVVSTSKICGNIRKKIKNAKLAKQKQEHSQIVLTESKEIRGSVDEYELLSKTRRVTDVSVETPDSNNPEIRTAMITDEDGTDKPTEIDSNEIKTSVEQVQDVTSTKNESTTENSLLENIICNNSRLIQIDVENSNSESEKSNMCDVTVSKTNTCGLKLIDSTNMEPNVTVTVNSKTECLGSISNITNILNETDERSSVNSPASPFESNQNIMDLKTEISETQMTDFDHSKNILNLYNKDSLEEGSFIYHEEKETCKASPTRKSDTNTFESHTETPKDKSALHCNASDKIYKTEEIKSEQSNSLLKVNESVLVQNDLKNPKSETKEFIPKGDETINSNLIKNKISHNQMSLTQESFNEPEALEINITDEDREIDGMTDEKMELCHENIALTTNEIILEID